MVMFLVRHPMGFTFLNLFVLLECPVMFPPTPVILLLAVPRRLFCFGSLVVLDVVCGYFLLFLLDIKIEIENRKICKNRF